MKSLFLTTLATAAAAMAAPQTVVHPEEKFDAGKSVVWSPLFQVAWDRMDDAHGGNPVQVDPPNALVEKLGTFEWNHLEVLPDDGWKVWSGPATAENLAQANREAASMAGRKEGPFRFDQPAPGRWFYHGFLQRALVFQKEFYRSRQVPMLFKDTAGTESKVEFFGVKFAESANYGKKVRVLAYRPSEGFHALQILTQQGNETVVLYQPSKEQDFATACRWLRTWMDAYDDLGGEANGIDDRRLHDGDEVRIPYVSVDADSDLTAQLQGWQWRAKAGPPRQVMHASQQTTFELHERGARVEAVVEIDDDPFGPGPVYRPVTPRSFIYDRPFFVFLWRDGAEWPYFGCWTGNADVLKQWSQAE